MKRLGGAKSFEGPQLINSSVAEKALVLSHDSVMLGRVFQSLLATSKEDLAYINKFVPFVSVLMKQNVPSHVLGHPNGTLKIQSPTQSFHKLSGAGKALSGQLDLVTAFVKDLLYLFAVYPRNFYEVYVCQSLGPQDALLTSLLSYVQACLVLPELAGMPYDKVQKVFKSIELKSAATVEGQRISAYATRSLSCSCCFHMPELFAEGCYHMLSKFNEDNCIHVAQIIKGEKNYRWRRFSMSRSRFSIGLELVLRPWQLPSLWACPQKTKLALSGALPC